MTPSLAALLHDNLSVEAAEDGLVSVTVTLPADLVQDYCQFLQSLSGFFNAAHRQSVRALAERRSASAAAELKAKNEIAKYRARLVELFDDYTGRGLDRKAAVKSIAADLRAESHPWCSPDLVRSQLVAAGRGGRPGRPRRGAK